MSSDRKSEKPQEQEAVFTTIVGGRPPGSGTQVGNIPRGIEVLVKKASVDSEFREMLLEKRAEAAKEIDLELDKTEADMLAAISREQLEKIIENTKVSSEHKSVFLGRVGKAILAIVLAGSAIYMLNTYEGPVTKGISPDKIQKMQMDSKISSSDSNDKNDPNSEKLQQLAPEKKDNISSSISRGISPVRE